MPAPTFQVTKCAACKRDRWHAITELANLRASGVEKFNQEHPGYTGSLAIITASTWLRVIWQGGKAADSRTVWILGGEFARGTIASDIQKAIAARTEMPGASLPARIRVDWKHREVAHVWETGLQQDLYDLAQDTHHHPVKCSRPKCSAPLFIATKLPRTYCRNCKNWGISQSKQRYEDANRGRHKRGGKKHA